MRRLLRNTVLLAFHAVIVRPVLRLLGVRYRRRNMIPRGPCVLVANHNSHLDAPILLSLFPLSRLPRVHPAAAMDYFGRNWLRKTMAGLLMNAVPIERKPAPGVDPLRPLIEALERGESLIFFPEGSRGEAGVVAQFRPGVGRLVRAVPGLLVVPVFMSGPERIWPRGHVVPVPLSIDAHVGKPRSYSPDSDAKQIATDVRRDLLALAPPPPPVPGPRPSPATRVAVCGIDPEYRRRVFLEATRRFGKVGATLAIGDSFLESDENGVRDVAGGVPLARGRVWLGLLGRMLRTGGRSKGSKLTEMVHRARIDEALDHAGKARFLVGDGNALVDLLAWAEADFYRGVFEERELQRLLDYLTGRRRIPVRQWWRFVRRAPEVWLISTLRIVRPPIPDVLLLARVGSGAAMARIRSRGDELGPHDNEEFLAKLDAAYTQVASVLRRRSKVEVIELDEARPEEESAAAIDEFCRGLAAGPGERRGMGGPSAGGRMAT